MTALRTHGDARDEAQRHTTMYIISEVVSVRVDGAWYDAEILDITGFGTRVSIYVYIFDLKIRKNISAGDFR